MFRRLDLGTWPCTDHSEKKLGKEPAPTAGTVIVISSWQSWSPRILEISAEQTRRSLTALSEKDVASNLGQIGLVRVSRAGPLA